MDEYVIVAAVYARNVATNQRATTGVVTLGVADTERGND